MTQAGETPLWTRVERAYQLWVDLGGPSWDRLGLTVTPDGLHSVWLDEPSGDHRWILRTVPQTRERSVLREGCGAVQRATVVQSSRCTEAVRDLQTRIRPYRKVTAAREFDDRAREALTPAT